MNQISPHPVRDQISWMWLISQIWEKEKLQKYVKSIFTQIFSLVLWINEVIKIQSACSDFLGEPMEVIITRQEKLWKSDLDDMKKVLLLSVVESTKILTKPITWAPKRFETEIYRLLALPGTKHLIIPRAPNFNHLATTASATFFFSFRGKQTIFWAECTLGKFANLFFFFGNNKKHWNPANLTVMKNVEGFSSTS